MSDAVSTTTPIAEYSPTAAVLADLQQMYAGTVYDVTSKTGMVQAKEARAHLRKLRTDLEKTRVEIKEPALTRCRQIDSEAKRITAAIVDLEDPIDQQIKAEEQRKEREKAAAEEAERKRQEKSRQWFETVRSLPSRAQDKTLAEIDAMIAATEATEYTDDLPPENRDAGRYELRVDINGLKAVRDRREQADRDAAELAQLREQNAARERELEALRQAERDRQAEAHRVEQARIAAELREQREREDAERIAREREQAAQAERDRIEQQRLADLERERKAQEKREANKRHVAKVKKAAADTLAALVGIDKDHAAQIIDAIAAGAIPAVTITY